jgi:hypothetical protein
VELVDQPIHRVVLARGLGIEDVADADDDLADPRTDRDERGVIGHVRFGRRYIRGNQALELLRPQRAARAERGDHHDHTGASERQTGFRPGPPIVGSRPLDGVYAADPAPRSGDRLVRAGQAFSGVPERPRPDGTLDASWPSQIRRAVY